MKKLLQNTITKSVVFLVIPTIYSVLFSVAMSGKIEEEHTNDFIAWSVFLFLLHIALVIYYGVVEWKQNDKLKDLEEFKTRTENSPNELKNVCDLLKPFNKVVLDIANRLYECIKSKREHSDIQDWRWMEPMGDDICNALYNFVNRFATNGNKFSVSMIFKKVKNNQKGYTMMSRASYDPAHTPRSYRSFVSESDAGNSYYKKVIEKNPSRPEILMDKKEIEKNFVDHAGKNYSQYIALPISCKGKTVGIIQIVGYDNSVLSKDRKEIERICNEYLSLGTNIMLLTNKSENIKQLIV